MKKILIVFILLSLSSTAWAHRINVFAYIEGQKIKGEVYFSDGSPAKKAQIIISYFDNPHKIIFKGQTDQKGNFSCLLPNKITQDLKVVAIAEMGHKAEMKIHIKSPHTPQISMASTSSSDDSGIKLSEKELKKIIDQELEKKLAPIQSLLEAILKETTRPSLFQVGAGLGYILGLFGIIAWLYSRKK